MKNTYSYDNNGTHSVPYPEENFKANDNNSSGSSTDLEEASVPATPLDDEMNSQRNVSRHRWTCGSIAMTLIAVGGVITLIYFYAILDGDVNNLPSFEGIFDQSPFEGVAPEDASRWANFGTGLNLEVANCLERRWYPFFDKAIADWDTGYPDALTLEPTIREPEYECNAEHGKVKVCNGDYGETGWKGQAEVFIDTTTNTIFAVSARMNEFYIVGNDADVMQYAMCHELGHAWGLHHTDESFTNRDLGNCMDYTNRHHNNLTPDRSNYEFLHAMYGLVPGAEPFNPPTPAPTMAPIGAAGAPTLTGGSFADGNPGSVFGPGGNPGSNGGGNSPWSNPGSGGNNEEDEKEDKKEKKDGKDRDLQGYTNEWIQSVLEAARMQENAQEYESGEYEMQVAEGVVLRVHNLGA